MFDGRKSYHKQFLDLKVSSVTHLNLQIRSGQKVTGIIIVVKNELKEIKNRNLINILFLQN